MCSICMVHEGDAAHLHVDEFVRKLYRFVYVHRRRGDEGTV